MISKQPLQNTLRSGIQGLLACSLLAVSSMSLAADSETTWFGEVADGQWLAGIKLGAMSPDNPGFQDAGMATFVFGYQFSRPIGDRGSASVELELGVTNSAGIDTADFRGEGDWDAHTLGLFMNYRSPGTVYFKGKLGILDSNIDARYDSGTDIKFNDTAFAYGIGAGVRLGGDDGRTTLEAEWMGASGDNDVNYYNLGVNFEF